MTILAQVFRVGQIEHDLLQTIGLIVAGVLLTIFAFWQLKSDTLKRPRLVSILTVIGVATVIWSVIESASRLCQALVDQWSRNS